MNVYDVYKKEKKELKKSAMENFVNPYKVGDVVYRSWGYEQTNVNFYQVVQVKAKSVVIQEIGQVVIEAYNSMCESVKPDYGNFKGEPKTKMITPDVYFDLKENGFKLRGYAVSEMENWDKVQETSGLYQSHYA